jgi:hypothetical protein
MIIKISMEFSKKCLLMKVTTELFPFTSKLPWELAWVRKMRMIRLGLSFLGSVI